MPAGSNDPSLGRPWLTQGRRRIELERALQQRLGWSHAAFGHALISIIVSHWGMARSPLPEPVRRGSESAQPEWWVLIGDEEEGVGLDSQPPAKDPFDEVEQTAWVLPGEQHRKPGDGHCDGGANREEDQHDVVRNREQPLDQWQPSVEILFDVGEDDVEVNGLVFVRGGVAIVHHGQVREHPGLEADELKIEVEPPTWVLLAEHDHEEHWHEQWRCEERSTVGFEAADCGEHDSDRDDPEDPKQRRHAAEGAIGVVDRQGRRVRFASLMGRGRGERVCRGRFGHGPIVTARGCGGIGPPAISRLADRPERALYFWPIRSSPKFSTLAS